jgi:cell division protein FtsL
MEIYIIVFIVISGLIIATKFDKLKDKIADLETRIEDLESEQSTGSDDVDFPDDSELEV